MVRLPFRHGLARNVHRSSEVCLPKASALASACNRRADSSGPCAGAVPLQVRSPLAELRRMYAPAHVVTSVRCVGATRCHRLRALPNRYLTFFRSVRRETSPDLRLCQAEGGGYVYVAERVGLFVCGCTHTRPSGVVSLRPCGDWTRVPWPDGRLIRTTGRVRVGRPADDSHL